MGLGELVGEARAREREPMPARERIVAAAFALIFVIAAGAVVAMVPPNRGIDVPVLIGVVLLGAIARRVPFEIGSVEAFPDQLVLIPTLFLVPLPLVPLVVVAATILGRLPEFVGGRMHPDRWLYPIGDAIPSVAAVVVLAALAPGDLSSSHAVAYAVALAAQLGAGIAYGVLVDYALGIPFREALAAMLEGHRIDAVLTPMGYMAAAVAVHEPILVIGVLPLMWL